MLQNEVRHLNRITKFKLHNNKKLDAKKHKKREETVLKLARKPSIYF